jgi:hypothetical protein
MSKERRNALKSEKDRPVYALSGEKQKSAPATMVVADTLSPISRWNGEWFADGLPVFFTQRRLPGG